MHVGMSNCITIQKVPFIVLKLVIELFLLLATFGYACTTSGLFRFIYQHLGTLAQPQDTWDLHIKLWYTCLTSGHFRFIYQHLGTLAQPQDDSLDLDIKYTLFIFQPEYVFFWFCFILLVNSNITNISFIHFFIIKIQIRVKVYRW